MREKTVSKLLGLSALAVIGASLMIGGCGSEPGILLQPTPFEGLATPTPTPEFVFTANAGISNAGSLSSLAVAFEVLSPAILTNTETGEDADNISVVNLQPVALTIENGFTNLEAYSIDPGSGQLAFLLDNTAEVNTAFGDVINTANAAIPGPNFQSVFGVNTVAYTYDDNSGNLAAFNVAESGNNEGALSQTGFVGTGLSPSEIDDDFITSMQLVNGGSNTFLLTSETDQVDPPELETWLLDADGSFSAANAGSAGIFDFSNDSTAITGTASFANSTSTFVVVTSNTSDQNNTFVLEMDPDGSGNIFLATTGTNESNSLQLTDANNASPVGVVVQTVGTQLTAEVTLSDGTIVPVPINADGTFGTPGTSVVPPTNELVDATGANAVIPSAADPNLFFLVVTTNQTGDPDFIVPVSTVSGAAVFGVAQATGSTGAAVQDFVINGGDAHFAPGRPHHHHHHH